MGNERITKIDDLPAGRAEIGADAFFERCFELVGETGIVSRLPLHPDDIIISRNSTKGGTRYSRHNLRTGRETFLYKADDVDTFFISDRTGEVFGKTRLEAEGGSWIQHVRLYDRQKDEITLEGALSQDIAERYTLDIYGEETGENGEGTGRYYIGTDKFSDKVAVYTYDAATDSFSDQPVLAHPEFSIRGMIFSQREEDWGRPLGFAYDGDTIRRYWLDPEMASIQRGLEAAYPGKNVTLNDWTDDRNRVLFTVGGPNMPPSYFLLLDKSKVAIIGQSRPWIDASSLSDSELIYYEARDGLKIPALLSLPADYQPGQKVRGAIVHPHGGPWARDRANFDSAGWVSYFTSRGYAVLRPQYRGSTDLGRKLWLAGDGEWGGKMQDDKDDGAYWMVEQGIVDPDKIAIHGYSYGGFAAIAASVRPDGPYRCAIAGAGVSNLTKLGNNWGDNRIQRIFQGNTVTGMDPMQNTDKIDIPILLYHGDYDVRVPLWHSRDFYNAIRSRSPESRLIVMEQMGHQGNKWLPEHTAEILREMENYLSTVCGM